MTINSDVTIFNLRIGADRREKFYATRILGVSWYGSKGQVVSDTVRKGTAQCVIRIPYTAIVEGGKQYISEEEYSEKAMQGLKLAYPVIPDNLEAAVDELLWFYACGKRWREKRAGSVEGASEVQRIYSFEHDDDYIYSAFLTQYHIDLQDIEYLHWWKFKALLRTLSSDLEFCKIMEYRSVDINANMTKEQRDFYRRKKELYALPLPADEEEKVDAIAEALMNGGDLTGLL